MLYLTTRGSLYKEIIEANVPTTPCVLHLVFVYVLFILVGAPLARAGLTTITDA